MGMLPALLLFGSLMATAAIKTFLNPLLGSVPQKSTCQTPHRWQYYVTYNCLSMRQTGRQQHVLHEFNNAKIVCLQGTRDRASVGKSVQVSRANGFTIVKAGYMHSTNSHSGVTIAVNSSIVPDRCIHSISYAEGRYKSLQGRILALRTRSTTCDLMHINMYFPPQGAKNGLNVCKLMLEWLMDLLRNMSQRTVPIIYTDANSLFE